MKRMIPLLLALLLLAGCAEPYDGPTETKLELSEYSVEHYAWEDFPSYTTRTVYAYDIYGNRVQERDYRDGEAELLTKYTYDENGNELRTERWDLTGWIPWPEAGNECTYDDQGRILTRVYKNGWGMEEGRSTYTYDDENHTMTWKNSIGDQNIYYYDENGLELRVVSTGIGGNYETVYQYDARGNRTGWTSTRDGVYCGHYEAEYDEQNRLLWGTHYDENGGRIAHTTYSYDDEAHTTTIHYTDGRTRTEYYDADGRLQRIEDHTEDGELSMTQSYFYREIQVPAK